MRIESNLSNTPTSIARHPNQFRRSYLWIIAQLMCSVWFFNHPNPTPNSVVVCSLYRQRKITPPPRPDHQPLCERRFRGGIPLRAIRASANIVAHSFLHHSSPHCRPFFSSFPARSKNHMQQARIRNTVNTLPRGRAWRSQSS